MTDKRAVVAEILDLCRAKGLRIATAESCTGGLLSAALTDIAGSSDVFECGFVTYSNAAKMRDLAVNAKTLSSFGAVSEQTALAMAIGAADRSGARIAVAITGVAGPGGSPEKPEGLVCFAIVSPTTDPKSHKQEFGPIGRQNVRVASVDFALDLILRAAKTA